jgi:putative DNA primase/helicase
MARQNKNPAAVARGGASERNRSPADFRFEDTIARSRAQDHSNLRVVSTDAAPLRAPPSGPVTEDSTALEFVERFSDVLRYDHDAGAWFRFDGSTWKKDGTSTAFEWVRQVARDLALARCDDREKALSGRASFARGVESFARADRRIAVDSTDWDRDHFLLGTPGGTVDLRTGELRKSNAADFISKSTAVTPAERADCPRWLSFLHEALGGDVEVIAFLQRYFGYCLTGDVREQTLIYCVGEGGDGKSVMLNVVRKLLGDYGANAAMDSFVASYGDKHSADIAKLAGKRFVTALEIEKGKSWDEKRLKTLTGGDSIDAKFMHKNYFTFDPTFKFAFAANDTPDLKAVNRAMRRRIVVLLFDHPPAEPDLSLEAKLHDEGPGILRWLIEGCLSWQDGGLRPPAAVRAASEAYFHSQDTFARWLDDECVLEPGNALMRTSSAAVWSSWQRYADQNGKPPGRRNEFTGWLKKRGVVKSNMRLERGYAGIKLRNAQGDDW